MHQRRASLRCRSAGFTARAQPGLTAGSMPGLGDLVWNLL